LLLPASVNDAKSLLQAVSLKAHPPSPSIVKQLIANANRAGHAIR